jgi:hypothetical protein
MPSELNCCSQVSRVIEHIFVGLYLTVQVEPIADHRIEDQGEENQTRKALQKRSPT